MLHISLQVNIEAEKEDTSFLDIFHKILTLSGLTSLSILNSNFMKTAKSWKIKEDKKKGRCFFAVLPVFAEKICNEGCASR